MMREYFGALTDNRQPWKIKHNLLEIIVMTICAVIAGCGEIVSIDGKTVRRSGGKDQRPIHMVSAWANSQQMVLGQLATDEKSNEITAVPELLEMLDVAGCIITADAMSCQKEIVRKITEKEADYVLGLKDNQPTVRREDYSRIRRDHSAENMAVVRRIALNILKNYPANISLARKRHRCAYDDAFFADVMNSLHA